MPEIEIRPATLEDIPFLIELEHGYTSEYVWQMDNQSLAGGFQVSFQSVRYPRSVKVDYPRPFIILQDNWHERAGLLVATLASEPIGYASLTLDQQNAAAWVTDLIVRRRLHRKGIGTALLLTSLDWAAEHDCREVVVAVQPKNHPAINLLRKLGFGFSGYKEHHFPNGDIGLFFSKDL